MSATASRRDRLAKLIAEEGFEVEDLQELRFAMVMTGGVSLAIWMGGATREFDRVIHAESATYLELLRLTRSLPRIDVITGTSAGGLNGALLAYAITQGTGVAGLGPLWLKVGALERLLRQPTQRDPPSLMLGDDYFLPQIEGAIAELTGPGTSPRDVPMELVITTTLLKPWPRGVPDTFGTIIHDVDHRGEFVFRRGVSLDPADPSPLDDDFADPDIQARLALAARCTASFPVAFEASYVPMQAADTSPGHPDMTGTANFEKSRFVIDGGVLLNRPLRPALRAIFRQPASKQVRRVLAYVVPDPGDGGKIEGDDPAAAPQLADVTAASIVRIPRNQSVSAELDELTRHNAEVDAQRRRRELVAVDLDVDGLARSAYPQYRGFRADLLAGWLLALLARGFTALEVYEATLPAEDRVVHTEAPLRERAQLREQLTRHLENLPPAQWPAPDQTPTEWFATVETVERAASVVLDLLRRGMAATDPRTPKLAQQRRELRRLRDVVCQELATAQATRKPVEQVRELELARQAVLALRQDAAQPDEAQRTALSAWAARTLPAVLGSPAELQPVVGRIADMLVPAAAAVVEACAAAPARLRARAQANQRYAEALVRDVAGTAPGATVTPLHRLLALDVVQLALGGLPIVEQRVDLIQISGDAGNGLDRREQAEEKLAGLQVAHFGAFYKRSWRANDWMWGRHDAAQRLAQLLLEPARLRQLGYGVEQVVERVEAIAFAGLDAGDERVLRAALPRPWDPDTARAELSFLVDHDAPPPATLPMCAQAVARRLQLDILLEELPQVRQAITLDEKDGAEMNSQARAFCQAYDEARARSPQGLTAADAISLFHACEVGQEKLTAESGSDLLARTATRTLAVTTSAFSGTGSGLPKLVQQPLRALRGIALMLYLVVRYALEGSRAGALIATAALSAGATLVGVGLVVDIPGVLMVIGLGAMFAAVALALWRGRWIVPLVAGIVAVLVGALPQILGTRGLDWIGAGAVDRAQPVTVVAGLLLGAFILGWASFGWPKRAGGSEP